MSLNKFVSLFLRRTHYRIIEMYLPISKFFSSPPSPPQTGDEQSNNRHDNDSGEQSTEAMFSRSSTVKTSSVMAAVDAMHSVHNSSTSNANDIK